MESFLRQTPEQTHVKRPPVSAIVKAPLALIAFLAAAATILVSAALAPAVDAYWTTPTSASVLQGL